MAINHKIFVNTAYFMICWWGTEGNCVYRTLKKSFDNIFRKDCGKQKNCKTDCWEMRWPSGLGGGFSFREGFFPLTTSQICLWWSQIQLQHHSMYMLQTPALSSNFGESFLPLNLCSPSNRSHVHFQAFLSTHMNSFLYCVSVASSGVLLFICGARELRIIQMIWTLYFEDKVPA